MKKAYFQYYETFENIVQRFKTAEEREHFREIIINYGFYGSEPTELNELESMAWILVQELIDQQTHRREVNKENARKTKAEEVTSAPKEEEPKIDAPAETPVPKESEPKETKKKFEKPSVEEVKAYIKEKQYKKVDAEKFVNYYESNGWRVGKNPMKNWRAAVSNWEHSGYGASSKSGTMWGRENEVPDEIINML